MSPVLALLAALAMAVWAVLVAQHLYAAEDVGRRVLVTCLLWAVAVGAVLVGLASSGWSEVADAGTSPPAALGPVQRAVLAAALPVVAALSVVAIFYAVTRRLAPAGAGRELWYGYAVFASASLLAAAFGTRPAVLAGLVLTPLVFAAVYVLPPVPPQQVLGHARRLLLGLVYLSAGAALLAPSRAFSGASRLQFLGVEERLQGVLGHPNGLGAVSALALVLTLAWARSGRGRGVHVGACALVLVLTESRAAWASAVIGILVVWMGASAPARDPSLRTARRCVAIVCIGAGAWLALSAGPGDRPAPVSRLATGIDNLNGRTTVWKLTVEEWKNSPVVGYGPLLWSDEYREERYGHRFSWAGQAHNQFVQSLGAGGILGLLALLAYLGVLLRSALRTRGRCGGAALALLVTLLVQMLNETPLRNHFVDPALLAHLVVFSLLLSLARSDGAGPGDVPGPGGHPVVEAGAGAGPRG